MVQMGLIPPLDSRYGHVDQSWPMKALCRTLGDLSGKKLSSPVATIATMSGKTTYRKAEPSDKYLPIFVHLEPSA